MFTSPLRDIHAVHRGGVWAVCCRYNLTEAVGSWAYMAPEVVLGQPYNEKVDVFSFGVILFEVLNRKLMLVDEIKNDPRKDAQVRCSGATSVHQCITLVCAHVGAFKSFDGYVDFLPLRMTLRGPRSVMRHG